MKKGDLIYYSKIYFGICPLITFDNKTINKIFVEGTKPIAVVVDSISPLFIDKDSFLVDEFGKFTVEKNIGLSTVESFITDNKTARNKILAKRVNLEIKKVDKNVEAMWGARHFALGLIEGSEYAKNSSNILNCLPLYTDPESISLIIEDQIKSLSNIEFERLLLKLIDNWEWQIKIMGEVSTNLEKLMK